MSLIRVEAVFSCDECGKQISTMLDESYKPPVGWSVFDVAEDALRGGGGSLAELTSVVGNEHLCSECTLVKDNDAPN